MGNVFVVPVLGEVVGGSSVARSDQRRENLRQANHVRLVRAELKRRLADGSLSAMDVLTDPPQELLSARVVDVLRAVPKVGPVKARTVLAGQGMSPVVRFGDLSPARRSALVATLEARGHGCLHEAAHKPIVAKAGTKR